MTNPSDDDGATAVLMAVLMVVIFGMAALAVEITDMYSRDRASQTVADVAALSGAQLLPEPCAAGERALQTLTEEGNSVRDDARPGPYSASASQMSDRDLGNGEIQLLTALDPDDPPTEPSDARWLRAEDCDASARFIRVVTPPRTISFAFASVLPDAPRSGTVQAVAAVELRGLDVAVLPFHLPDDGCLGSRFLVADDSSGPATGTPLAFDPAGGPDGPAVAGQWELPAGSDGPIAVTVSGLAADPGPDPEPGPDPSGAPSIEPTAENTPEPVSVQLDFTTFDRTGASIASVTVPTVTGTALPAPGTARFQVQVPAEVSETRGVWWVRAFQPSGTRTWSDDSDAGRLSIGLDLPTVGSCDLPAGPAAGLLTSPRAGSTGSDDFVANLAGGLDHDLAPVGSPLTDVPCTSDGTPYPDAVLDTTPTASGSTCVAVRGETDPNILARELVAGLVRSGGRLEGPAASVARDCSVQGQSGLTATVAGNQIASTALSCHLEDGRTLADVVAGDPGSLDPTVVADPRFFLVPVTATNGWPTAADTHWPVTGFVGAFVTDEQSGGDASCELPQACNGLLLTDDRAGLRAVQAVTFPLSALPEEIAQPTDGRSFVGGTKDFVLVE